MNLNDAVTTLNKIQHRGRNNWKVYSLGGSEVGTSPDDSQDLVLTSSEAIGVAAMHRLRVWLEEKKHLAPLMMAGKFGNVPAATGSALWMLVTELVED